MGTLTRWMKKLCLIAALAGPQRGLAADLEDFILKPAEFKAAPTATATVIPTAVPTTAPTAVRAAAKARPAKTPSPTPAPAIPTPDLSEALAALSKRLEGLEKAAAPSAFKLEGALHLRYDRQHDVVLGYGLGGAKAQLGQALGNPGVTASRGSVSELYVRRADLKLSHELLPWAKLVIGWDVAENKLRDAGLELKRGKALKAFLGQARLRFGVEPQVSSTRTLFIERALVYGGLHPFLNGPSALVRERAMGLHLDARGAWAGVGGELGASLVNNAVEDQAAGKNKPGATGSFPAAIADPLPSLAARAGWSAALPAAIKLGGGVSYLRDSQNSAPQPANPSQEMLEEAWGLDAGLSLPGGLRLGGEWLASQRLRGTAAAWTGVDRRREGWYATLAWDCLRPWLGADAPPLEVLARAEGWSMPGSPAAPGRFGAYTLGLRWQAPKGWHSALNYSVYSLDDDAGALAGAELLSLQQQLAF